MAGDGQLHFAMDVLQSHFAHLPTATKNAGQLSQGGKSLPVEAKARLVIHGQNRPDHARGGSN